MSSKSERSRNLDRIRKLLSRAEKRGYNFDVDFKESIRELPTEDLQLLTPDKIYERATYSYGETTVSGTKQRKVERSMSAKKAAETRKHIEQEQQIDEGEVIWDNFNKMIDSFETPGAVYLSNLLKSEVRRFGKEKVVGALGKIPSDVISSVQNGIYYISKYSGEMSGDQLHRTFKEFAEMIRDTIPTLDEAKMDGEVMDQMSYYGDMEEEDI